MSIDNNILSLLVFFPLLGALVLAVLPYFQKVSDCRLKTTAFVITLVEFLLSLPLFFRFDGSLSTMQFEERIPWLADLGISYHLGVDGLSLLLVLLTTFLFPITVLCSWNAIKGGWRAFLCLTLFLESALIGAFTALDMILFFIFWEAVLIPMYFIIGIWGSSRRVYAAIKFFIYTAFGSGLMLVAIIYMYYAHIDQFGFASMNLFDLQRTTLAFSGIMSPQGLVFLAFFLAFAIKVPMFPFHTWLPDAHVEAPTPGSVILAGVLLKMGTYAVIRFLFPFFPEAIDAYTGILIALSITGIIYGAMVAFMQKDLKKLVAYSSVSHMGLIMLGVFIFNLHGVQGGIYQMIGHGLSTGALFILVGMIYERRHTKMISEFGGLAKIMPLYALFFMIAMLASIGLPLLNGFVGEFLILLGVFAESYVYAALGATGLVLGAVYMLWAYQRVMFGPVVKKINEGLSDLNPREIALMIPLAAMIFLMGVYPQPFLSKMEPTITKMVDTGYKDAALSRAEAVKSEKNAP